MYTNDKDVRETIATAAGLKKSDVKHLMENGIKWNLIIFAIMGVKEGLMFGRRVKAKSILWQAFHSFLCKGTTNRGHISLDDLVRAYQGISHEFKNVVDTLILSISCPLILSVFNVKIAGKSGRRNLVIENLEKALIKTKGVADLVDQMKDPLSGQPPKVSVDFDGTTSLNNYRFNLAWRLAMYTGSSGITIVTGRNSDEKIKVFDDGTKVDYTKIEKVVYVGDAVMGFPKPMRHFFVALIKKILCGDIFLLDNSNLVKAAYKLTGNSNLVSIPSNGGNRSVFTLYIALMLTKYCESSGSILSQVFLRNILEPAMNQKQESKLKLTLTPEQEAIAEAISSDPSKGFAVVQGPPGQGKSVIAKHLCALELSTDEYIMDNKYNCTEGREIAGLVLKLIIQLPKCKIGDGIIICTTATKKSKLVGSLGEKYPYLFSLNQKVIGFEAFKNVIKSVLVNRRKINEVLDLTFNTGSDIENIKGALSRVFGTAVVGHAFNMEQPCLYSGLSIPPIHGEEKNEVAHAFTHFKKSILVLLCDLMLKLDLLGATPTLDGKPSINGCKLTVVREASLCDGNKKLYTYRILNVSGPDKSFYTHQTVYHAEGIEAKTGIELVDSNTGGNGKIPQGMTVRDNPDFKAVEVNFVAMYVSSDSSGKKTIRKVPIT